MDPHWLLFPNFCHRLRTRLQLQYNSYTGFLELRGSPWGLHACCSRDVAIIVLMLTFCSEM